MKHEKMTLRQDGSMAGFWSLGQSDGPKTVFVSGYLMPNTKPMLDVVYKNCKIIEIERHDTYVDGEKKKQEVYNVKAYADKEALWKDALSMIKRFQLQGKPVLLFGFHEYT